MVTELFRYVSYAERLVIVSADPFHHIQDIGRDTGVQEMADLERFVCHFHKEQIEGIVTSPARHIVFPFVDIE